MHGINTAPIILIVSCVFPPEPLVSARISKAIAEQLSKEENIVVLCPTPTRLVNQSGIQKFKQVAIYEVVTLSSYTCKESRIFGRLKESYEFGKAVAAYIKSNHKRIKAIYANTHPTFGQYLLLNAAQKYGIPCAIHIQDIYPESITSKIGLLGKIINPFLVIIDAHYLHKASTLIAISGEMKRHLTKTRKYSHKKIQVVFNWQNEKIFLESKHPIESKSIFTFMFLGNINPTANIPTVINAFGQMANKDTILVIAGSGTDKGHCQEIALQYPCANIVFTEVLPNHVPAMQAKADVLLLPLLKGVSKTAMPSKLPAYMFSAKPILACVEQDSDVGRIIIESQCGWVTEPENINELSRQMKKCIEIPKERLAKMGENGREFGLNNFSTNVNLNKICTIIKGLNNESKRCISK